MQALYLLALLPIAETTAAQLLWFSTGTLNRRCHRAMLLCAGQQAQCTVGS
jgi:hypothetical protein